MQTTDDLAALRYVRMRWNTPLSEEHAALLLQRLDIRPGARVLDLGCGWGELLLRAVAAGGASDAAATTGVGVDTDPFPMQRSATASSGRLGGSHTTARRSPAADMAGQNLD
ncbi:SAM-dependent methyltransferase [Micromonospora sp. NPDC006431]|uniref:SAM-dependent methyltransferase n=1 Tax=Micromonospora sp. NPDC006431 TaxID=3364235 RepID=UPI003693E629